MAAGDNAGSLKRWFMTQENFKNRFSFGGQSSLNKKSSLFTCNLLQVISSALSRSNTQRTLPTTVTFVFYGLFGIKIADPVLFYVSSVSRQITDGQPFTLKMWLKERSVKYRTENRDCHCRVYQRKQGRYLYPQCQQDTFNEAQQSKRSTRFGPASTGEATNILLETSAETKKVLISFASLIQ